MSLRTSLHQDEASSTENANADVPGSSVKGLFVIPHGTDG